MYVCIYQKQTSVVAFYKHLCQKFVSLMLLNLKCHVYKCIRYDGQLCWEVEHLYYRPAPTGNSTFRSSVATRMVFNSRPLRYCEQDSLQYKYVQGVREKLCFTQFTATPPSPVQPIAVECWRGRGGKLPRILGKKTQNLMNSLYVCMRCYGNFYYFVHSI